MKTLILTPLSIEYNEVRKHLISDSIVGQQENGVFYEVGKFKGKHHDYEITITQTGAKNNDIALMTEKAIQFCSPDIVILTGIAGGVKDAKIGDVVVANKMYGYESGKETPDGFVARPEAVYCSSDLFNFSQTIAKSDNWKNRSQYGNANSVFYGAIAAGDKVVASTDSIVYKRLKTHFNDSIALEMEAIGFGKAMLYHPLIKFINIRGVSDLLNDKTETDAKGGQEKAIANAVAFLFEMIYQLDYFKLNIPKEIVDAKLLAKNIYKHVKPLIQKDAGLEIDLNHNPYSSAILTEIKSLKEIEYEDFLSDLDDEDNHAAFRNQIKKVLIRNAQIAKTLSLLLKESQKPQPEIIIKIDNRKNVISGGTFSNIGKFHQGEVETNIEQQVNNPIYIENAFINQVLETAPQKITKDETQKTIQKIYELIEKNQIREVFKILLPFSKSVDTDLHHEVLALMRRYNSLTDQLMADTISGQKYKRESNKLFKSLLHLVDKF